MYTKKPIDSFRNEYFFLSNMYPCKIHMWIRGKECIFDNAEAAFQAHKCEDLNEIDKFIGIDGKTAKRLGRRVKLVPEWNEYRLYAMNAVVYEKFKQNSDIREELFKTVCSELIEGNNWNDTFWGVCRGKGQNNLGRILMQVRTRLLFETTWNTN